MIVAECVRGRSRPGVGSLGLTTVVTSVENYPQVGIVKRLALSGAIGTREHDVLLAMKDAVANDLLGLCEGETRREFPAK